MTEAALATETPQDLYTSLMACCQGDPLEDTLARMLSSWLVGNSAMPAWLGLNETEFQQMMHRHFPGFGLDVFHGVGYDLDVERSDEMSDLRKLLIQNRTSGSQSQAWMVEIVISGCLGDDHLWQDLGLWNRSELSQLMLDNFEPLAKRNDKDMKWKKFLYKQLCETEGIYTCRAPSCEVCNDFQVCFGPEE